MKTTCLCIVVKVAVARGPADLAGLLRAELRGRSRDSPHARAAVAEDDIRAAEGRAVVVADVNAFPVMVATVFSGCVAGLQPTLANYMRGMKKRRGGELTRQNGTIRESMVPKDLPWQ